jgi:hypothetical protein
MYTKHYNGVFGKVSSGLKVSYRSASNVRHEWYGVNEQDKGEKVFKI